MPRPGIATMKQTTVLLLLLIPLLMPVMHIAGQADIPGGFTFEESDSASLGAGDADPWDDAIAVTGISTRWHDYRADFLQQAAAGQEPFSASSLVIRAPPAA